MRVVSKILKRIVTRLVTPFRSFVIDEGHSSLVRGPSITQTVIVYKVSIDDRPYRGFL